MRIIGYTRLSRASREESTSIVRQRELIAKTCEARGYALVAIIDDVDVSATKTRLDRPGLNELRRRIADGEADAVMVWRLDRLVRSVVDVGLLLEDGLQIISATEALDTTSPMGRAMVEILQVFAAMEAKTTGLRVSASQEHLRRVGRWPGGVLPYGYRPIPHPSGPGRALEPDPVEAAVVRRMADEVLAGESVYTVTMHLNKDGIRPRRAASWTPSSVSRIVRGDAVLGRVRSRGELVRDPDTGLPAVVWPPLLRVEEVLRIRDLTDWTPTPGRGEATTAARRRKASRLLSGLLFCAGCGRPLVVLRRDGGKRHFYACHASTRGQVCPRGTVVEAYRVEEEVERQFLALVGHWPVIEPRVTASEPTGLAAAEEALRQVTDAMREPGADIPGLVAQLRNLSALRDRLAALPDTPTVEYVRTGETFASAWATMGTTARRSLLQSAGATIALGPGVRGKWTPSRVRLTVGDDAGGDAG